MAKIALMAMDLVVDEQGRIMVAFPSELVNTSTQTLKVDIDLSSTISFEPPLEINNSTASLTYNATNLRLNGSALDTIQDIDATATPTFAGLATGTLAVTAGSTFYGLVSSPSSAGATFNGPIVLSNAPSLGTHATNKDYVDGLVQGLDWQDSVIDRVDFTTAEPAGPSTGERYINTVTGTSNVTSAAVTIDNIYQWTGSTWDETVADEGMAAWVEDENILYVYNGSAWVKFGATVTHANLSGLQGGTTNQYYHLTLAEHTNLTEGSPSFTNLSASGTISGGTLTGINVTSGLDPGHKHSTLTASDGSPDPAVDADVNGNVGMIAKLTVEGAGVFNNAQGDNDFRIKSNFIDDILFVQANGGYAGRISFGLGAGTTFFDIVVPQNPTAGANAEGIRGKAGIGGLGDITNTGGDGGTFIFAAGQGGQADTGPVDATGGPGGTLSNTGGEGGYATSNTPGKNNIGGHGGISLVQGGAGGGTGVLFGGGAIDNTGGDAGQGIVRGGRGGGTFNSSGTNVGGVGGDGSVIGGNGGGALSSGTATGGNAGNAIMQAGIGGTGATANGLDGEVLFKIGSTQAGSFERDGTLSVDTANYETLVADDDDIPNKKYVDDAISGGGAATKEFNIEVNANSSGTPTNSGLELPNSVSTTAYFFFKVPADFTSLTSAKVGFDPNATGNAYMSMASRFGVVGESADNTTDSVAAATVAMTNDVLVEYDVTAGLTGLGAGDYTRIVVTRDGGSGSDTLEEAIATQTLVIKYS